MVFKSGGRVEAKVKNLLKVGSIVKASGLQRSVLLGHTIKGDGQGGIAGVYLHLYPGDEIEHLAKINAKAREENEKHKDFMLAEWRAFQEILITAPLQRESGRARTSTTPPGLAGRRYSAVNIFSGGIHRSPLSLKALGTSSRNLTTHPAPASAPQPQPHGQQGSTKQGRRALCSAPSHHLATGKLPPRVVARTSASSSRQAALTHWQMRASPLRRRRVGRRVD